MGVLSSWKVTNDIPLQDGIPFFLFPNILKQNILEWLFIISIILRFVLFVHLLLQIVDFLQKREDFVDLMIKHIGTSAIMDLLLRMLTCIEPQQLRQDVLNVGRETTLSQLY